MTERPRDLPDFANPPVVEVALSVQFEPLEGVFGAHIGALWESEFRREFPRVEEHVPIAAVVEQYDGKPMAGVHVEFRHRPEVSRSWFLNELGTELVQVQRDRFVRNWRKVGEGDRYPRYEQIRRAFGVQLEAFRRFLDRNQLGPLRPNQCEVTYINHLVPGTSANWDRAGQLHRVLTLCSDERGDLFLPEPEDIRLHFRHVFRDSGSRPLGRLHVSAEPGVRRADHMPVVVLTLTARGAPLGDGLEGVLGFLDLGRKWVVSGFASVTRPKMHSEWGRRDGPQSP